MNHHGTIGLCFEVPKEQLVFNPQGAKKVIEDQRMVAMREAGRMLLDGLSEGEQVVVSSTWSQEHDDTVEVHRLTVDCRPIIVQSHRQVFIERMADNLCRAIEPRRAPPKPSPLSRVGRFFADKWREAGETVQQCKAAA